MLGMTETATVVVTTSEHDILHKSSGSLVPGTRAKLVDLDGSEITEYDKPGELLVQSPSVTLGYHNNEKATAETFIYDDDGRWIRTGDEVLVTLAPSGNEHFVVVDRIKELIKVKVKTQILHREHTLSLTNTSFRGTKWLQRSLRHTSSRIQPFRTAQSSKSLMITLEKSPRHLLSRLPSSSPSQRRKSPRLSSSMLPITRPRTNISRVGLSSSMSFPKAPAARFSEGSYEIRRGRNGERRAASYESLGLLKVHWRSIALR